LRPAVLPDCLPETYARIERLSQSSGNKKGKAAAGEISLTDRQANPPCIWLMLKGFSEWRRD